MTGKVNHVLCYTRTPKDNLIYSPKLAYSMHLAYSNDGSNFQALNHNSGVLFVKATENDDGTLNAKSLKNPYIFNLADGNFGVLAVRTEFDGENDTESKGQVFLFTSPDLLQYQELGSIDLHKDTYVDDVLCKYDADAETYLIHWSDEQGNYYKNTIKDIISLTGTSQPEVTQAFALDPINSDIEGIVPRNIISVTDAIANRLVLKLTVPTNVKNEAPASVNAKSLADLNSVKATAFYSDGTTALKPVDWDTENIDWNKPGTYEVTGTIHQDHYQFPIAINRADPCIKKWNGKYYFIATNDADGNRSLYVREADTIPGLVDAEESLILDVKTYEEIGNLLWAPEFHEINGELYIMLAASTGEFFHQACQLMKLSKDGNPAVAADWSRPKRVEKQDGTILCEAGKTISLDMTYFKMHGEHYVVWSQRQFLPVDQGAWLYIAKLNPDKPWMLASDPVLLSRPEYGWANNNVFVDEGAYALIRDGKIYMTFASALVDTTYVVGILTADQDSNLLDPASWTKGNYPLLTSRSVPGEYGPGHNSYVMDDDGLIWNAYHARPAIDGPRSSGIRRVHFDVDGYPRLNLTEDKDLNQQYARVSTKVII